MFRLKFVVIIGGCILAYLGFQEVRVGMGSSTEPIEVDLAMLESGTTVDDNHIRIGPHMALHGGCVYEYKAKKYDKSGPNPSSKVTHVYFPVISGEHPFFQRLGTLAEKYGDVDQIPDSLWPSIDNFKVLVKTKEFKTIGSIPDGINERASLQGLVINQIGGMDKEETRLLQSSFPQANLDEVLVIEQGRKPSSYLKSFSMLGGGSLLALAGVVWLFAGWQQD